MVFKNLALKQIEAAVKQWDGVALAFIKHKRLLMLFGGGRVNQLYQADIADGDVVIFLYAF